MRYWAPSQRRTRGLDVAVLRRSLQPSRRLFRSELKGCEIRADSMVKAAGFLPTGCNRYTLKALSGSHNLGMANCLLYYGTSEGQTEKIAQCVAEDLRRDGHRVDLVRGPASVDLSHYDAVVVGDSVHIGRFHRHVRKFVRQSRALLATRPTAFFAVCLSVASATEQDRQAGRNIGRAFLERSQWQPHLYEAFAGALKYSQYGFFIRKLMQRIAKQSGQTTSTDRDYEYTDWDQVHRFAASFGEMLAANPPVERPQA